MSCSVRAPGRGPVQDVTVTCGDALRTSAMAFCSDWSQCDVTDKEWSCWCVHMLAGDTPAFAPVQTAAVVS